MYIYLLFVCVYLAGVCPGITGATYKTGLSGLVFSLVFLWFVSGLFPGLFVVCKSFQHITISIVID